MFDEQMERFLTYVQPIIYIACWVFTFSCIRLILVPARRTFRYLATSLFVSVPTGVLAGGIMKELGYGEMLSTGVACAAAIFAHDLFTYLLAHPKAIGRYIDRALTNIIDRTTK